MLYKALQYAISIVCVQVSVYTTVLSTSGRLLYIENSLENVTDCILYDKDS